MQPDQLRDVFADTSLPESTSRAILRHLFWLAWGLAMITLLWFVSAIFISVWELTSSQAPSIEQGRDYLPKSPKAKEAFDRGKAEANDRLTEFNEIHAEIGAIIDAAEAYADPSTYSMVTVRDWRNASSVQRVIRSEMWLRNALELQTDHSKDNALRVLAIDLSKCVDSLLVDSTGIENTQISLIGALCIARNRFGE